jgi:nitrogen fixation/metabolism regulation signal transduction histidine kinase
MAKDKVIVYGIDDLTELVLEENFVAAEEVINREGIKIKYGNENNGRKRQKMTELRNLAYSLQRDMRAMQYDTSYIRSVLKGLTVGNSW